MEEIYKHKKKSGSGLASKDPKRYKITNEKDLTRTREIIIVLQN